MRQMLENWVPGAQETSSVHWLHSKHPEAKG